MKTQEKKFIKKELTEFWEQKFGKAPFPYFSKVFLEKYLNYYNQQETDTIFNKSCQKQLDKLIKVYANSGTIKNKDISKAKTIFLPVGTRLVREFKGEKYEVFVEENGYKYKGALYESLSSIANTITGTKWNGKVFFGVKEK